MAAGRSGGKGNLYSSLFTLHSQISSSLSIPRQGDYRGLSLLPQIKRIKQIKHVLKGGMRVTHYTDYWQHASQVLTDTLAERHSKVA